MHDRATRGETLTAEEQSFLTAWYETEDTKEIALLSRENGDKKSNQAFSEVALIQEDLRRAVKRLQAITAQNESLRSETARLQVAASHHTETRGLRPLAL